MLSIIRSGPKMIVFGSKDYKGLESFLITNLQGEKLELDSALELSDENSTIVLITQPYKNIAHYNDILSIVLFAMSSDEFFTRMFNLKGYKFIEDCHIAPGIILMRTMGDEKKIIESVKDEYGGKLLPLHKSLDEGTYNDSIICFTSLPLDKKIHLSDINEQTLLVNVDFPRLTRKLRIQALRFLNEGLVGVDWKEIYIRIYDRYSEYKLHYERLSIILDNMDLGIILGETWAKDYPRFMMSVLVYQIRLFTLKDPKEIKKVLLGLEYLENGERIVDFDLIYKNKKIDWPEVLDKENRGLDRWQLGLKFRNMIFKDLDEEMKSKILNCEKEIIKSRT